MSKAKTATTAIISGNRVTAERRAGEDRRHDGHPAEPQERRASDRRRTIHGIEYVTTESLSSVQNWLEERCQGRWSLALEAMDSDRVKKTVRILFENPDDKQIFMANFSTN
ncbi:MAG: hypothetical protein FJX42_07070 [Alphaproteobacteria bacterium]|nr:hypothetical protein [Alphaproteobacteria bacterium]